LGRFFYFLIVIFLMNNKILNKKNHSSDFHIFQKRQWGTERQTLPLSNFHEKPSNRAVAFSRFSIVLTVFFWAMYVISVVIRQLIDGPQNYRFTMEVFGYLIIVTFLTFSALVYLIARQGALQRFAKHLRIPRAVIDKYFSTHQPSVTVLIPSYSEETQVIRKTILSAALQEYPNIRIVLLVDDKPLALNPKDAKRLEATRALGVEIEALFSKPHSRFSEALLRIENIDARDNNAIKNATLEIAAHYMWAEKWLNKLAEKEVIEDHVDVFFAEQVLRGLANDIKLVGQALISSHKEGIVFSIDYIAQLCRRLVWTFSAEVDIFERKKYISLSHEPNKAMNLNSYIGLMGGAYIQEQVPEGTILSPTDKSKNANMIIPDSDFVLTLDADSILLREYCLRLVYFLQQSDNANVAVAQTPYSSFRGASTRIERLSGATTDIQHIIHQGMSYYDATFWVGANAMIRKCALNDIVEKEWIGGFEIKRYVQDSTVIEDTESSIDLALHNWRLINYPERLSYSATPPDFGSLVIQRRRWANGGLLILPKLWALLRKRKNNGTPMSKLEFIIRLNYMASIAWSNIGLVFLLVYPYDGRLLSPLVLLAATPYFLSMAIDLKYCRYRYSDIIRIYGFNLILLPVNIAGTLKSLQQGLSGNKTPFARTPKVKNRTAAALPFVISPLFIVGFSLFTLWRNIEGENLGNAIFAGFNAFASIWAIFSYIGVGNLIVDIWVGIKEMLYTEACAKNKFQECIENKEKINWQGVLYHGEANMAAPHEFASRTTLKEK
jgi:cellulose synthase/poly-beta-1,6-N-acetylglucosamine synthase-like glycosyltransferase